MPEPVVSQPILRHRYQNRALEWFLTYTLRKRPPIGSSDSAKRCIVPLRRVFAMAQPIVRTQVTGFFETARRLNISSATFKRDWQSAPIWLTCELARP
jgi:hypothetical protein